MKFYLVTDEFKANGCSYYTKKNLNIKMQKRHTGISPCNCRDRNWSGVAKSHELSKIMTQTH